MSVSNNIYVKNNAIISGELIVDDIDAITAGTLLLGKATATKVEIGDNGVITEIQGPLNALGAITMNSNRITGLGAPTDGMDAATKTYVDGVGLPSLSETGTGINETLGINRDILAINSTNTGAHGTAYSPRLDFLATSPSTDIASMCLATNIGDCFVGTAPSDLAVQMVTGKKFRIGDKASTIFVKFDDLSMDVYNHLNIIDVSPTLTMNQNAGSAHGLLAINGITGSLLLGETENVGYIFANTAVGDAFISNPSGQLHLGSGGANSQLVIHPTVVDCNVPLNALGAITMNTNKVTGLGAPTDGRDAAHKTYVDAIIQDDTADATFSTLTVGGTAPVTMGSMYTEITNLTTSYVQISTGSDPCNYMALVRIQTPSSHIASFTVTFGINHAVAYVMTASNNCFCTFTSSVTTVTNFTFTIDNSTVVYTLEVSAGGTELSLKTDVLAPGVTKVKIFCVTAPFS